MRRRHDAHRRPTAPVAPSHAPDPRDLAAAALFCVLGGGVWWTVTVVGLVIIAAWFVVDRKARQRRPDGRSRTTGLTS